MKLSAFEKQYPWGLLGFLLGVVALAFAIYISIFYEKVAIIEYQILSTTEVIEVKENVNDLSILYNNEDILNTEQKLKLLILKVINTGDNDLNKNSFDNDLLWGIEINKAQIFDVNIIDSNSDYIANFINPTIVNGDSVIFNKIILDESKYFTLKILYLINTKTESNFTPIGKITGQDTIHLKTMYTEEDRLSFFDQVFSGNIAIQSVRTIAYSMFFIFMIIVLMATKEQFGNMWRQRKREKTLENYYEKTNYISDTKTDIIFDLFLNPGYKSIDYLEDLLRSEIDLQVIITKAHKMISGNIEEFILNYEKKHKFYVEGGFSPYPYLEENWAVYILKLENIGIIFRKENNVYILPEFLESMKHFREYLASIKYSE